MENCIKVIGIGLEGAISLDRQTLQQIEAATVLVGSRRHLAYFPEHPAKRLILGKFGEAIAHISAFWQQGDLVVILVSGDPLFFGLGRLLLESFPSESLQFYPHVSSLQLAFARVKVPWQDAKIISVHGRSLQELTRSLQQGCEKIAVLTDENNSPSAIASLYLALDLPTCYQFWVCENLGGEEETVRSYTAELLQKQTFSPLNVLILLREEEAKLNLEELPLFGLPDAVFLSFRDRPGLMTKREIRISILGELALKPKQIIWDIGAGTGSVAIEMARLHPNSHIYAVEKTAMGANLIRKNCQRLQVKNVTVIEGAAPDNLTELPHPDRIFIGGSGGNLLDILPICQAKLQNKGVLVLAFATLEHLHSSISWLQDREWDYRLLNLQISRSVPIGQLTRFSPLNPVTIITAKLGKIMLK
ncbi:precorrin-6y C5,15-methyltransferase (decarboxylating) subunit CbiE [Spirulina sp. 06S082]|uniref:precorrin-6y C5,15-methyltransferase (decarboxylating) subunit CbiE n=1 Tax=Spirulina sp. 06S082 TaxID=3110248 RepID=UPI002B20A34F|nr:precorrin-6y C5,15-methyltransferase (decarboxylating) subunit CbiE [Spirulina sp. 06S082]MEA5472403.1 precorrin-6y C5,15-methyltransferase (decarboxylating) subunit CbiE [Spirulina sp. 06S082]